MFDIGFSELLLIAVVGLIVIGPKDLPVVMRHGMRIMRELRGFYNGIRGQVTQLMDEAGIDELKRDVTTIIDLEGKPQKAYDVGELEGLKSPTNGATRSSSPLAGEERGLASGSELSRSGEGASEGSHLQRPPTETPQERFDSPAGGEWELAAPAVNPKAPVPDERLQ